MTPQIFGDDILFTSEMYADNLCVRSIGKFFFFSSLPEDNFFIAFRERRRGTGG